VCGVCGVIVCVLCCMCIVLCVCFLWCVCNMLYAYVMCVCVCGVSEWLFCAVLVYMNFNNPKFYWGRNKE